MEGWPPHLLPILSFNPGMVCFGMEWAQSRFRDRDARHSPASQAPRNVDMRAFQWKLHTSKQRRNHSDVMTSCDCVTSLQEDGARLLLSHLIQATMKTASSPPFMETPEVTSWNPGSHIHPTYVLGLHSRYVSASGFQGSPRFTLKGIPSKKFCFVCVAS